MKPNEVVDNQNRSSVSLESLIFFSWLPFFKNNDSRRLAQSAIDGPIVASRYGCHAHLYEMESPKNSHGSMLVWCFGSFEKESNGTAPLGKGNQMSILDLLSLCRIANTARKRVALIDIDRKIGLVLTYTTDL